LNKLNNHQIHAPWQLTLIEQQLLEIEIGNDYPKPLVDIENNAPAGKDRIWGIRKVKITKAEGERILKTHTRRKKENTDKPKTIF
jgi:deoxyribodipyrimidine photo-lyase